MSALLLSHSALACNALPLPQVQASVAVGCGDVGWAAVRIMGALAIVDRLLRGNFELGIKITLGFFPMRS